MENKKNIDIDYAGRFNRQMEGMWYNKKYFFVQSAVMDLAKKKGIKIKSLIPNLPDGEESFLSFREYDELQSAERLFTLVGKCPKDIKNFNIEFLNGNKKDIVPVKDNELIEKYEMEGFKLVWVLVGQNAEIRMLAYISESDGYMMPILDKEIESDYGGRDKELEDPKFWGQYRGEEDGFEYISEIFDFLFFPSDDYSYSLETENYLTDQDEIDYEDRDDNTDEDEEEEDEWIYPDKEDEDEEGEWTEDIEDDEEGEWTEDINKALAEETRLFDEHTITITVLSVTDLQGQQRTLKDGTCYQDIHGFEGKILPIVIGEEMTIYDPKSVVVPIPEEKLHTAPVIFHSEELVSDHEVHHIIKTKDSIYFLMEHKDQ